MVWVRQGGRCLSSREWAGGQSTRGKRAERRGEAGRREPEPHKMVRATWGLATALRKPFSLKPSVLTCVMRIKPTSLNKKVEEEHFEKKEVIILIVSLRLINAQPAVDDGDSLHTMPLAGGRIWTRALSQALGSSHTEASRTIPVFSVHPFTLSHTQLHQRKGRAFRVGDISESLR